jgi:hypothetical protein
MFTSTYKLYGTLGAVIVIAIFIIYSNASQRAKRRRATNDYALKILEMPDSQLKSEIQSLAHRSKELLIIPDNDILEEDDTPHIQRMYKIAVAEFNRRGLID